MSYSFTNLSHADFEDLSRDLVGRDLGVRFEGFGPGPDGGVDGRHAAAGDKVILQCKHYAGSAFSALSAAMRKERPSIDVLNPTRYILTTSRTLTPTNKSTLSKIIGSSLRTEADILGPADLNTLIRRNPDIERANIKLWLSSTVVLDRVVRAASYRFTAVSKEEIEAKVKVYAPNPSFKEARDKLEAEHVVIISGPPGVGKTTLAEMLSYAYIGEDWEYVAIRSLDDGFASIVDARKQIFFFDDFLGRAALDKRALAAKDSDLARFIRRVRSTMNARFVLTTRAPIFEEARRISEHLADRRLDITKYVLDVGVYTRRIKARILYNHLVVAGVSREHIRALWDAKAFAKIVDHKNYNPRIIEAMTDGIQLRNIKPEQYAAPFQNALDNPLDIWDVAFRTHIAPRCRHLLFSLFFCSEYGVEIDELRSAFNALHPSLCVKFSIPHDAKDFEETLKILEGGFVEIRDRRVSFVNPSLRDYMISYLDDGSMLKDFAMTAQKAGWARELWNHARIARSVSSPMLEEISRAFLNLAETLKRLPIWKKDDRDPTVYRHSDLSNVSRLELLLEWHAVSGEERFLEIALEVAAKPVGGFSAWEDGASLVKLIGDLQEGTYENVGRAEQLCDK
jgi:DNA polymerase III delta prime subunit